MSNTSARARRRRASANALEAQVQRVEMLNTLPPNNGRHCALLRGIQTAREIALIDKV